jgi:cytochrome c
MVPAVESKPASATEQLAESKTCLNCHAIASKLVGPAHRNVAARSAKE